MIVIDKNIYNEVIRQKLENESIINQIYANFENYTQDEKYEMLDICQNLAVINEEFQKYIIVYNKAVQQNEQSDEYIVVYGDTIHSIARKITGNYENWKEIMRFNNLSDINLEIGTILLIPRNL
jgi:LysM repeat protein